MTEHPPNGEHHFDGHVRLAGCGEHPVARAGVQGVEAHHHHVPAVVGHGALQHRVSGIGAEPLGEREKADRPFVAQALELRHELGDALAVLVGADTVQVVDVDPVSAELPQRFLHRGAQSCRVEQDAVTRPRRDLRGDDDAVAVAGDALPDDLLGPVRVSGVDVVDAAIDCSTHEPNRIVDTRPVRLSEPAVPSTPETGDADPQTRAAEHHRIHVRAGPSSPAAFE